SGPMVPLELPMLPAQTARLAPVTSLILTLLPCLDPVPGPPRRGRPPVVPIALLWSALFLAVLGGSPSQRGIWRTIASGRLGRYPALPISSEAVRLRLLTIPPAAMASAFTAITTTLRETLPGDTSLAPRFPGGVFALDATTL